jgi:hypothetical protein
LITGSHAMLQRDRIEVSLCGFARGFRGNLLQRCFANKLSQIGQCGRACQYQ